MSSQRYYVGQYGYFWSFTRDELVEFFRMARDADDGYDLPSEKELRGCPKGIYRSDNGGYWSSLPGRSGRYYEPLDWDAEAFDQALEELGAK